MIHCYRVELTRKVISQSYSKESCIDDIRHIDFTFGNGSEFRTGRAAYIAALAYAKNMLGEASSVSIWRLTGGNHGYNHGSGRFLKDDYNSRFSSSWEEMSDKRSKT